MWMTGGRQNLHDLEEHRLVLLSHLNLPKTKQMGKKKKLLLYVGENSEQTLLPFSSEIHIYIYIYIGTAVTEISCVTENTNFRLKIV